MRMYAEHCLKIHIRLCLKLIVSGKEIDVECGWSKLQELHESHDFNQLSDCEDILRDILKDEVLNTSEIPKIMMWMSKYIIEKPFGFTPISNDIAVFLRNTDIRDMSHFTILLETLLDYKVYLPGPSNHTKLSEEIVRCLSFFHMHGDPKQIAEFHDNIIRIQNFLQVYTKIGETDILFTCLQTLYNIISDTESRKDPGAGLVALLQVVEPTIIPQAVNWILSQSHSDDHLRRTLKVLCNWLPQWKGDRLSVWVMEFIRGLENQHKYTILLKFTESSLEPMFKLLLVPIYRQNAFSLAFYMLKKQSEPAVIEKMSKQIAVLIARLIKENNESNKEYIQNLVDIMEVMSLRYPDKLLINLPVPPRADVVKEICSEAVWKHETKEFKIMMPYSSLSGKVGLSNLGNTCYMNSVLQALRMTRQFCQEVLNYPLNQTSETPLLKKLQNLFALLLHSKKDTLSPTEILQASRPTYFLHGQQQDSSEFLCHLLDVLHEQDKSANTNSGGNDSLVKYKIERQGNITSQIKSTEGVIKRWTTEEDLTEGSALQRKTQSLGDFTRGDDLAQVRKLSDAHSDSTDSGIQSVGAEETNTYTSLVHRVLGGESKTTYQCTQCDTSSHNTDKFRDLQLCFPEEIQENQEVSVQDLINYYLTPEKLTGENKYRCDKCTKLCDAQRIMTILQAPAHLILTLKHFRYDFDSRLRTKLRHKVLYNDTIQLPISTVSYTMVETYQLYAAVVHSGYNMDYGHYFTYACDSKQNWYKFNDSFVSQVRFENFKNLKPPDTPYILFYEKLGALDGIYEDDKPELSTLSKHLQELIQNDNLASPAEKRQNAMLQRRYLTTFSKQKDNSDDDNPPPSNCRDAFDITTNRFLY